MQVSKTLDYAVRSLTHIAQADVPMSTIKDIATQQHIPHDYLAKILRTLVQRGILHSSSGPDGGYSLKKNAGDISLKDVYEASYRLHGQRRTLRVVWYMHTKIDLGSSSSKYFELFK